MRNDAWHSHAPLYTNETFGLFHFISHITDSDLYQQLLLILTSFIVKTGSRLHNIGFKKKSLNLAGAVPNTLYIPSFIAERNIFKVFRRKVQDLKNIFIFSKIKNNTIIECGSASNLTFPTDSVDYIFVDPPFGNNLMYSELNYLWESWLKVFTDNRQEAIMNTSQNKGISEYKI